MTKYSINFSVCSVYIYYLSLPSKFGEPSIKVYGAFSRFLMYASSFSKSNTLLLPFPEFETSWRDLVDSSLQQKSNQKQNEQKQIFDKQLPLACSETGFATFKFYFYYKD